MKRLATANANLDNYFTELPAPAPLVVFPDPTGLQSSSPGKKTAPLQPDEREDRNPAR